MTAIWFLPGEIADRRPKPARRRLAALLAGAVFAGGVVAFCLPHKKPALLQRPGPRRYPPAYRGEN